MKTLKDLFEKEIHVSTLSTALSVSIAIGGIVLFTHFKNMMSDIHLIEDFLRETTQNALILNAPLSIQRSVSELWRSYESRSSTLSAIHIEFDQTLVAEAGNNLHSPVGKYTFTKCFPTSKQNVCASYEINLLSFLTEILVYIFAIAVSTIFILYLRKTIASKNVLALTTPLELEIKRIGNLIEQLKNPSSDATLENTVTQAIDSSTSTGAVMPIFEVHKLTSSYKELIEHKQNFSKMVIQTQLAHSLSNLAKQVSHDIRSPLSALNAMTGSLNQLPEDKRTMIRNAVLRINDIANDLLEKGRKHEADTQYQMQAEKEQGKMFKSIFLLAPLVDSIVSEKRIQYRDKLNISIEVDLAQSYGLFAEVNTMDLKRVISNLINNSCEAFDPATGGTINVAIRSYRDKVGLIVADNGKGIPESILAKLGQQGVTHGKEGTTSGSGLGIYHAKKTITALGGDFQIASKPGMGTIITMTFPKSLPPKWFVTELQLPHQSQIVALDDDQAIHNLWSGRFQSARAQDQQIQLINYTSAENLMRDNPEASLYLMDYELLGQQFTGLDVIEKMDISSKSILVTSRYEEKHIFEKCEKLGVKLIPKNMAAFVPITIKS